MCLKGEKKRLGNIDKKFEEAVFDTLPKHRGNKVFWPYKNYNPHHDLQTLSRMRGKILLIQNFFSMDPTQNYPKQHPQEKKSPTRPPEKKGSFVGKSTNAPSLRKIKTETGLTSTKNGSQSENRCESWRAEGTKTRAVTVSHALTLPIKSRL
ncbi:hypothetical protein AAL_08130 [Moelleriella libera RCEF 2490]|uniref:Uncharacterized protein n=1 Tax=Moelleriella libera RCEF 2490 TaxID=1081109 RepID=A0A167W3S7_9HYPO|nr:hypothetical protein AAL_08130 [Moelleriella libera RCEF 2490]